MSSSRYSVANLFPNDVFAAALFYIFFLPYPLSGDFVQKYARHSHNLELESFKWRLDAARHEVGAELHLRMHMYYNAVPYVAVHVV